MLRNVGAELTTHHGATKNDFVSVRLRASLKKSYPLKGAHSCSNPKLSTQTAISTKITRRSRNISRANTAACGAPELKAFLLMVAAVFMPAFSLGAIPSSLKPAKETARSSLVN